MRKRSLAAALGLLGLMPALAPAMAQMRSEIPIREVVLSDGTRRYGLTIMVGGTSIEAGLDSGSAGLRILPGVLKADDAKGTGKSDEIAYGAGTAFEGEIASATLKLGELGGASRVQLIRSKSCAGRVPNCPASRIPMEQFGIQGNGLPGEGFKAIFGTNSEENDVPNPLAEIGVKRWIIELPRPLSGMPGKLVLNPTEDETRDYVFVPLRQGRGAEHDSVEGCLLNRDSKASICGQVLLDTGAPGINVAGGGALPGSWPNGANLALGFYDGSKARAMENFRAGLREHASRLSATPRPGPTVIYAGLSPYFAFDVLYDPAQHRIGFKPRAESGNSPSGIVTAN
jgi:hypothetical protein